MQCECISRKTNVLYFYHSILRQSESKKVVLLLEKKKIERKARKELLKKNVGALMKYVSRIKTSTTGEIYESKLPLSNSRDSTSSDS